MIEKCAMSSTIDAGLRQARPAICYARSLRREQEVVGDLPVATEGASRWD
jgi:hypothetical protein